MDPRSRFGFQLDGPAFELRADGRVFTPATMQQTAESSWVDGDTTVVLEVADARDGSCDITLVATGVHHVHEVCLLDHSVAPEPDQIHNHRWYDWFGLQRSTALFIRGDHGGLFACYANPFAVATISGAHVRLAYRPAMDVAGGSFRSDPLVVGRVARQGREIRFDLLRGRDVVRGRAQHVVKVISPEVPVVLDAGEVQAVRRAVEARVPWDPARARVAHWDWGENSYRLDPADPDVLDIYGRLFTLCQDIGIDNVLLAPGCVHATAPSSESPWQHVMWLGMGTDVGHGRWRPGNEPKGLTEVVDGARAAGAVPTAYLNPQFLWKRNPDWKVVAPPDDPKRFGSYDSACLAVAGARRWLERTLHQFIREYGLGGVSLDFVFWAECWAGDHGHEPGPDSVYAQWDGYRQLLASLASLPDRWVEALIGSQVLMPWGAAGMTHPHPAMGDNQPQWMPAWPDLSLDRVNANYQRRTAWWYRNLGFVPSYKVPGQVGHQANRRREWPVERGWDWEGARYNLLSAIASGPSSLSVCYLPCWDEDEWQAMRTRDATFFQHWIGFARRHQDVLAGLEDLFGEPRPGAVDGTIATDDDGRGFVFLTNPDYVERTVDVPLPQGRVLRELHPQEGTWWEERVHVPPHEVMVLELTRRDAVTLPALLGVGGTVAPTSEVVSAAGPPGARRAAVVVAADGTRRPVSVSFESDGVQATLGPWRVEGGGQPIDPRHVAGGVTIATEWAPGSALPGLLEQLRPPIEPKGDEALQPWSDPSRLRLVVDLVAPEEVQVAVRVEGEAVPVRQAYVGTWEDVKDPDAFGVDHNLMAHYVDLTDRLAAAARSGGLEQPWTIEVALEGAAAGDLAGVHVAHLPPRLTDRFTCRRPV